MGKKYSTDFIADHSESTGVANQVLISTTSGISWVDGSGSAIIGGPYLPLIGGTLTGALTGTSATFAGNVGIGTTGVFTNNHILNLSGTGIAN